MVSITDSQKINIHYLHDCVDSQVHYDVEVVEQYHAVSPKVVNFAFALPCVEHSLIPKGHKCAERLAQVSCYCQYTAVAASRNLLAVGES